MESQSVAQNINKHCCGAMTGGGTKAWPINCFIPSYITPLPKHTYPRAFLHFLTHPFASSIQSLVSSFNRETFPSMNAAESPVDGHLCFWEKQHHRPVRKPVREPLMKPEDEKKTDNQNETESMTSFYSEARVSSESSRAFLT